MDGLGWSRPIVVTNVLPNDTVDVADAEEDEVVQCFLSECPNETFDVW